MEEISFADLGKYFVKHFRVFILMLLLVLLGGEIYSCILKQPVYKSSTTVAFSSEQVISSSDVTTAKSMVGVYTEIVKSELVIDSAIKNTDYDYETVSRSLSVSGDSNSGTIKITVTYDSPEDAKILAENITNSFSKVAKELYKNDNIKVINFAKLPNQPSNINIVKDTVIYIIVGSILGAVVIFIMFYFDKNIHSNEDVERNLSTPVIGNIRDASRSKTQVKGELAIKSAPQAGVSEDIRTLRANIEFGFDAKDDHVVLITSSVKGEGKSFISSNLAYALAMNGRKTLLIDCDLRRGRLHHIFKIDNLNGTSNLILNKDINNIDKYVREIESQKLYVIPRGIIPLNPSELLSSQNFATIINYLKHFYDYIILDGAPILNLSDSLTISKIANKTALVATANYTPIDALMGSKKSLENAGANIAGVVLNKVQVSESKYYYYHE